MFELLVFVLFVWLFVKTIGLTFRVTWGMAKITAVILFVLAVPAAASTDEVVITTQGWGHGVGFSQMGAVGYANEEGWSYVKILRHYFSVTGTSNHQVVMPVW